MLQTVRKFSREYGVPEHFVRCLVAQGKCPGVYSGTRFLVNVEAAVEFIEKESRKCMEVAE